MKFIHHNHVSSSSFFACLPMLLFVRHLFSFFAVFLYIILEPCVLFYQHFTKVDNISGSYALINQGRSYNLEPHEDSIK